jgi:hypothetical protein
VWTGSCGAGTPARLLLTSRDGQTNSITTRLPTKPAARSILDSVTSRFGSRIRSTCDRLVFSNAAMRALEIFLFFMAAANCEATTSFTGRARACSLPSKAATLDPTLFLRISMYHKKYVTRLSSLL